MLKLKNLIAAVLLSSVAVISFARAPSTPKNGGSHSLATMHKHGGHTAKPKHLKTKTHVKKNHKVRHHAKKHHRAAMASKA
jgi:hypothetical protein